MRLIFSKNIFYYKFNVCYQLNKIELPYIQSSKKKSLSDILFYHLFLDIFYVINYNLLKIINFDKFCFSINISLLIYIE